MTVFDCLKPLNLSDVGNDDRMLRNKFVVVCKCPGARDTTNCQMPGVYPGGMLAVLIDSHLILEADSAPVGFHYLSM